jgi:hypothetical protein
MERSSGSSAALFGVPTALHPNKTIDYYDNILDLSMDPAFLVSGWIVFVSRTKRPDAEEPWSAGSLRNFIEQYVFPTLSRMDQNPI